MSEEVDANDFVVIGVGLCYASVCTKLTDEETTSRLNMEHPTGVGPWSISEDKTFATGQPNPCPCVEIPGNRHILFSC